MSCHYERCWELRLVLTSTILLRAPNETELSNKSSLYYHNYFTVFLQIASNDLLSLDFEGILNYFRVSLPKKFQNEEDAAELFRQMKQFKVSEKKLTKYEKEHQLYLEQQAQLEDPVMRLEVSLPSVNVQYTYFIFTCTCQALQDRLCCNYIAY